MITNKGSYCHRKKATNCSLDGSPRLSTIVRFHFGVPSGQTLKTASPWVTPGSLQGHPRVPSWLLQVRPPGHCPCVIPGAPQVCTKGTLGASPGQTPRTACPWVTWVTGVGVGAGVSGGSSIYSGVAVHASQLLLE